MNYRKPIALLLCVMLLIGLSGCVFSRIDHTLDRAEDKVEQRLDQAEEKIESAIESTKLNQTALTAEEAERIALKRADFTAEQVTALHTEYEIDDGIVYYDVQFRMDSYEYEIEVHAETGEILSFERER